jgi:uncharacterized protein (DUF2141 family)
VSTHVSSTRAFAMLKIKYLLAIMGVLASFSFPQARAGEAAGAEACAASAETRLRITVTGVRSAKGTLTLMLYGDRDEDFLKKGARLDRIRVPAARGQVQACMPVPKPGSYAISLYHDEDGNKKLTKNWVGLPTEGYGFSRDAPVTYRLPQLDEAVITALPGDNFLTITMRY